MAFNSWDKLSKGQRDYPKPKFAVAVVEKGLKKAPKNPYLLAWRADLYLQQNADWYEISQHLKQFNQLPTSTDLDLLSYLYKIGVEVKRRYEPEVLTPRTVGDDILQLWKNAASAIQSKNGRLELWDRLFSSGLREECWDDVRAATVDYGKELSALNKTIHFTRALGIQLAAEQRIITQNPDLDRIELQFRLARTIMIQAYHLSPGDPRAVKDIRDLRFMADILGRQGQCKELFELWDKPPAYQKALIERHHEDLMSVKTRLLRESGDWPLLEKHCLAWINETLSELKLRQTDQPLRELCAWRFDLWESLLMAIARGYNKEESGVKRISTIMDDCFGSKFQAKDRSLRLTYLQMRLFERGSILSDCKEYWEHHSSLPTCFDDLLMHVEALPLDDRKAFSKFIQDRNKDTQIDADTDEDAFEKWQAVELNILKFDYLLTISKPLPELPTSTALENFIQKAIGACITSPGQPDAGYLAVYALIRHHNQSVSPQEETTVFDGKRNSRILLQATMLARHLVACEKYKEDRTLCLFAARLHLNLGLGTCAFQLYRNTKCKEMLLDTLSPYVLSRISLTHPFDSTGSDGFSADKELAKVIETIERMENKTGSYIFVDMASFVWDQALDALELKRKLKSSLTKHICMTERRRIARLKGEATEDIPRLDYRTYHNIEDSIDRSVFPQCEHVDSVKTVDLVMPNEIPNIGYLIELHGPREVASRVLYKEIPSTPVDPWHIPNSVNPEYNPLTPPTWTRAEKMLEPHWKAIEMFTQAALYYNPLSTQIYIALWETTLETMLGLRNALNPLRLPSVTTHKPKDEPTMFQENMFMFCYSTFEALRALYKLSELLREKVGGKAKHGLKSWLTKEMITTLVTETEICYVAVRDAAQSYINLIKTRGAVAIKAQVRWGATGKALMEFLKDEDVEFYAQEYVNSALEAWNGVMKVKLK